MFSKRDERGTIARYSRDCPLTASLCNEWSKVAGESCQYIKRHPTAAVAAGAAVGLLIGLLLNKK
ncbi:hypothetical protein CIG19_00745 [Enterobacterales bacterium CwR94]|nr:hypothetical protein CIG19_00745 [Enterobacterales bacterium CwR94]